MHDKLGKVGIKSVLYESLGTALEWQTWHRGMDEFALSLFK